MQKNTACNKAVIDTIISIEWMLRLFVAQNKKIDLKFYFINVKGAWLPFESETNAPVHNKRLAYISLAISIIDT